MAPGLKSNEGNELGLNLIQQWLWECWLECAQWINSKTKGDPWLLLLNGDLVDGNHHNTTQILSPDAGDQPEWLFEVLAPIVDLKPTKIALTKGTESHVRNIENFIARKLGAMPDPITGQGSWDRFEAKICDSILAARHHIGTTSRPYLEASMLSINLGCERQERTRAGMPFPDVLCCGHRHRHGLYTDGVGMVLVTGAWQALTRYGHKVVPAAIPQPSCFILEFSPGERIPLVHQRLWTPPVQRSPRVEV